MHAQIIFEGCSTGAKFEFGPSRHFTAMRSLIAYRGIADTDQAAPIELDL
jgi:hypothetical protein